MAESARKVTSFDESLFCQRLEAISQAHKDDTGLANLATATRRLLSSATEIAKRVALFLPQFTLHDDVHLWNVLGFMEHLAGGKKGIAKLGAGDCAMAVWAAFIHDLGMVLEAGELAALDAADGYDTGGTKPGVSTSSDARTTAWRVYRDQHAHWESIRKDPTSIQSRMKLGIIRANYVRDSHARIDPHSGHCRIAEWLGFLATGDRLIAETLNEYLLGDRVVWVAVSHNQNIDWLPRQLGLLGIATPHGEQVSNALGTIHWTWIGWLLRLADVFDCDKSRTPKILFDHGGITDARSQTEWQKHLAIPEAPRWGAGNNQQTLMYTCRRSPSPVVEKAIREIVGWMNDEIGKVRAARDAVKDMELPALALPSQAEVEIKSRADGYLYDDMEFRLDREAVIELLMGESLYGGPELALRELVQNALDAVHLRDMRNRLAEVLDGTPEKLRQPYQPFFNNDLKRVDVTWGTEADTHGKQRQFIRVRDYGVGMTIGTMKRFLTRIGKSYYKSDEFRAEQELMRANGILCTAISQFGIGFLSVFMLADEVTIHTRPVDADKSLPAPNTPSESLEGMRFPFRAEIHGPHGLLAFFPDPSVIQPGTTVTLWLKERFELLPWNREWVISKLREEFYERELPEQIKADRDEAVMQLEADRKVALDPAFEIGRFIVWPLYPVRLSAAANFASAVVLSDAFHLRELVPLNREELRKTVSGWGHTHPDWKATNWVACDWIDECGDHGQIYGTGSRVRLVAPFPNGTIENPMTPSEWGNSSDILPSGIAMLMLGSCCEPQLPRPTTRYQCLVNGVRVVPGLVPGFEEFDSHLLPILEDLPVLPGVGGWVWIDLRGPAMPRLRADRSAPVTGQSVGNDRKGVMDRWLKAWPDPMAGWVGLAVFCQRLRRPRVIEVGSIVKVGVGPTIQSRLLAVEFACLQKLRQGFSAPVQHLVARDCELGINNLREFIAPMDVDLERCLAFARDLSFDRVLGRDRDRECARSVAFGKRTNVSDRWRELVLAHLASEGFWPDISSQHPAVGLPNLSQTIAELALTGPLHVAKRDRSNRGDDWIRNYDISSPYTAFSFPRLWERYPAWTQDRKWRTVWMLPFLFGQELGQEWRSRVGRDRPFDSLMLFLPNPEHYEWLFAEHTREEWSQGSASALWDLTTGEVLYADGVHTEETLRRDGKPLRAWLRIGNE